MAVTASNDARNAVWSVHRWIGVALVVLLAPISLSGALLVFDDELDALLHPARYAVTGPAATLPPSAYLTQAAAVFGPNMQAAVVRFPESAGMPVTVMARAANTAGGPPRTLTVYLDPPTGRVLDAVEFRTSLFGILHRFHENLTIPEYSGRQMVGWAGAGMLALSLTGLWLWWPRNGAFLIGLRWRRAPATTNNLHHLFGFWISLPLGVVSLTGIYLAFPPQARAVMSSFAQMNPQQRPGFGPLLRKAALTADGALAAALAIEPSAQPAAIFLPVAARGANGAAGEGAAPSWRIQLRIAAGDGTQTILVNDQTGEATRAPDPLAGDRAAQWIRWVHEGSHSGVIWRLIVFMTGVFPAVLGVTGMMMWLRGRRRGEQNIEANATAGAVPHAEAAE